MSRRDPEKERNSSSGRPSVPDLSLRAGISLYHCILAFEFDLSDLCPDLDCTIHGRQCQAKVDPEKLILSSSDLGEDLKLRQVFSRSSESSICIRIIVHQVDATTSISPQRHNWYRLAAYSKSKRTRATSHHRAVLFQEQTFRFVSASESDRNVVAMVDIGSRGLTDRSWCNFMTQSNDTPAAIDKYRS